ncbi:mono-functional DNA-alkylating methyl methanesulfonate N-terminal domain-containing protein, partial [Klebsiella pneumoniae]|nr:mono-functional DNA-alkylating methyl methanesulfonate N-terminal domain-containing protein [Klebsiella pneumoniae]
SATYLPMHHDRVRVLFGTEDGRVKLLQVVRRTSWDQADLHVMDLGMAPVATAPQGVSSLAEDYVFLASNTGDSLVWHV